MRFICTAATSGVAIATVLIGAVVSIGAPSAHADTGAKGYASCVGNGTQPPPPGVSVGDWFPSVYVITTDIDSGVPSQQVIQRLIEMGVSPADAATRVRCFLANAPR